METITRISDQEIIQAIQKNPLKIEWDHNSSIESDMLLVIVSGGQESLDDYVGRLTTQNQPYFWEMQESLKSELCSKWANDETEFEALNPDASIGDKEQHIETLIEEHSTQDINISRLAKMTGRQYFVIRACEPANFQAWQGIRDPECLNEICELLQISPHHYQDLVNPECDFILPTIPEREGQNAVDIDGFRKVLKESMYGGELVFLCGMETQHVIENLDGFHTQDIIVQKGTNVMLNDYLNGCPSCADTPLIRDLVIPQGKGSIYFDAGDRCGVQSCCDMTPKPWIAGYAYPKGD